MKIWISNPEIKDMLGNAKFSSVVAFGYQDEDEPRFVMTIKNGNMVLVDEWSYDDINWDLRAWTLFRPTVTVR